LPTCRAPGAGKLAGVIKDLLSIVIAVWQSGRTRSKARIQAMTIAAPGFGRLSTDG
jgi:hypothetical protein